MGYPQHLYSKGEAAMARTITIALIGVGTVGGGVHHLIETNSETLRGRTGLDIRIATICDLAVEKVRAAAPGARVTADYREVLGDPGIDIVIELIGGIEPAKTIILEALRKGRHVVTANKKLLAEQGDDIFKLANGKGPSLGFEASVGGGIPCIAALKHGLVGNRIESVTGILNGTTNYILSRMQDEGLSFDEALKKAQQKGFAEADPTFDIEGFDAGHKIAILSMIAYNRRIAYKDISIEGITGIEALDIAYAREMGYVIKLLGVSKFLDGSVDIRVHPAMLPLLHPLASVRNEFNAVMFRGDMTGPVTLFGRGAGSNPTASAVVSDVVRIAGGGSVSESAIVAIEEARILAPEQRTCRYYLRINTEDRPGIFARIASVLASLEISIASALQKESEVNHVPVVIMTHEAPEAGMLKAVAEINAFEFVSGPATLIRVEDLPPEGERHG